MQFAFLHGDMGKLRSLSEGLVNEELHAGEKENAANELALHAQLESLLGNYGLARKLCQHAADPGNVSSSELWRCAEALGEAGAFAQAEALAAKLGGMDPEDTIEQNVELPSIRSIVERQRGSAIKAEDLLTQAERYGYSLDVFYRRAQADLAAGDPANAAVEFKTIVGHRGWGWWPVYAPLAQLGLARAYAMQGDRAAEPQVLRRILHNLEKCGPGYTDLPSSQNRIPETQFIRACHCRRAGKKVVAPLSGDSPPREKRQNPGATFSALHHGQSLGGLALALTPGRGAGGGDSLHAFLER